MTFDEAHLKGHLNERIVADFYLKQGHNVFIPVIPNGPVDLVLYRGGLFYRVEVKTATWITSSGSQYLEARTKNRHGQGLYDLMVVVYEDKLWEIPAELLTSSNICVERGSGSETKWAKFRVR